MGYSIRKAVVIGSGTMGGGIATLLAGVGVDTTLLDIPAKGTQPGDKPAKRNALVTDNLKKLASSRPPQVFAAADIERIRVGNLDDNLDVVSDADWVIEVVVERLDIKQSLMAKLAEVVRPDTIITTNTSGIPIKAIAEHLDHSFTRRFLGTHFFNPPRHLRLLEVIPHADTDPEVVKFMVEFGTRALGKSVVICKDRPNFIGNRFMSITGTQVVNYAIDNGFTVEEVDSLTGPLIGHPKTATFRLTDLVGLDIHMGVARNLYEAIPEDPAREVLHHEQADAIMDRMMANGWLGNKSGQGFYKTMKGAGGEKEFWILNTDTFEYEPPKNPRFESVSKHRKVEPVGERIRLLMNEEDRAGKFLWNLHAFYLAYASNRVPEITDTIVNVDNAIKGGFSHELGPFEIWDAIGVAETVEKFEAAGYPVADWVQHMVSKGNKTFYLYDQDGMKTHYYSPQDNDYVPMEIDPRAITVKALRARKVPVAISAGAGIPETVTTAWKETSQGVVASNGSASVLDMGDGVGLLEFHSQALAIDADLVEMGFKALDLLQSDFDALVVGHDGERFCIGANVFMVVMAVQSGLMDQLDNSIHQLQNLTQAMRYAPKPVVTAPFNMALGGGAEFFMSGAKTVAHAELYTGLVEVGVGLIPAGGGCKELLRRVVNPVMASSPNGDALPHLQKVFEAIATAKVSTSAKEAREMGFLSADDKIVFNRSHLLGEAKRTALELADGYIARQPGQIWAVGRDAYSALLLGIEGFRESGFASEHDALISQKLAYVLTGGALSEPGWVSEQYILDLERDAFLSLVTEPKTMERISHMLQFNKPLRN
ncbi:MAG: 3-hydroxyacyl-CoA dehydrogenase/enoyl-CoA hydratase family protein [Anaerolineae bacterium]|nr:3-hydroxyacyl-CoA dehydrogenase/enoyl-CoA hydratase family protein [Anaerolineae bacterium]